MSPSVFLCAFVVALMPGVVKAQQCAAGTAVEIAGNWYCSAVDKITYSNFPGTGYYNKVVSMDSSTGNCETVKYDYSGSLAPLNEEVSFIHLGHGLMIFKLMAGLVSCLFMCVVRLG